MEAVVLSEGGILLWIGEVKDMTSSGLVDLIGKGS